MTEYWFARYKPSSVQQNAGRGLVVLRWQGVAVIAGFVLSILIGCGLFVVGMLTNQIALGIGLWAACVIAGAVTFLWASIARTDPAKPASEYLAERQALRAGRPSI